ncbi:hypothetical protein [Actinomyces viscosus]|uniref:hypothetical protein n=1 Tax=Actinomyces viscosus TaxID=1656 RepID=UPI001E512D8B|nr:hypothetical protein [Actinomyces viscosus]
MAQAAESLGVATGALTSIRGEAQSARTGVVSEAPSVSAACGALGRCEASHGELIGRVRSMHRATWDACDGVAMVRRSVLACQDYAAEHPAVVLADDGSVSASPDVQMNLFEGSSGNSVGGDSAGGDGGDSAAEAAKVAGQVAELKAMVAATLAQANQVDHAYAAALTTAATPNRQPGPSPTPPDPNKPKPNRAEEGRGVAPRASREGRRSDDGKQGSIGGGVNSEDDWLGEGVPGTRADMPGVKPWQYSGDTDHEGSGEHGKKKPEWHHYVTHELANVAADACGDAWPDASKNLHHYLENTGTPQNINVDKMLNDLPDLPDSTESRVEEMANKAQSEYEKSGATGPVTYPFNTHWRSEYAAEDEDKNWFLATGGYQYATEGTITVYPPSPEHPNGHYTCDYQVHVADRYNWDGNKATEILGMKVTDKQLQELHQTGLAQEYDLVGESSVRGKSGDYEPKPS